VLLLPCWAKTEGKKRKAWLGPRLRRKGRWATGGEMEWAFGPE